MMSNPNPTRLSPAELRRRLLAPPADTSTPIAPAEEVLPQAPPRRIRSDGSRYGSPIGTQPAIDLEALSKDVEPPALPKLTPIPESRLSPSHFGSRPGTIPYATQVPALGDDEIRTQNVELTRLIDEMRPLLEEASVQEQRFQAKETEYNARIAEKDQQLEELAAKLKQVEEQLASIPPPKVAKSHNELEEWGDELEKEAAKLAQERRRMDQDRRQLHEDEESLEKQMREMECSMARERAVMARQETELKRLSAEIQHELDLLQRGDGTLREQLSKFQRRHQEVLSRGAGGPSMAPPPMDLPPPPTANPAPEGKGSGLFRRIFRGDK
jgi:hypothetical protein